MILSKISKSVLLFKSVTLFGIAFAQSNTKLVENEVAMATQAGGQDLFVSNPSIYQPKSLTLGYANVVKSSTVTRSDIDNDVKSLDDEDLKLVGLASSIGTGTTLIVDGYFWKDTLHSTDSNSNFATRPVEEYRVRKGLGAKLGVEISKGIRMGGGLRYHMTNATVLGSFFINQSETTQYKGSLLGLDIGGMLTSGDLNIGLAYATPLSGKIETASESKVTIVPGWLVGDLSFNAGGGVMLGATARKWKYDKDQMRERTTAPNSTTSQITLLGLSPEATMYPDYDIGIGIDFPIGKGFSWRNTAFYNQAEFISDTSSYPGKESNKDNRVKYYSARSAILLNHRDVDIQVGAYYAQRKTDFTANDGSTITYKGNELDYFATMRLVF